MQKVYAELRASVTKMIEEATEISLHSNGSLSYFDVYETTYMERLIIVKHIEKYRKLHQIIYGNQGVLK